MSRSPSPESEENDREKFLSFVHDVLRLYTPGGQMTPEGQLYLLMQGYSRIFTWMSSSKQRELQNDPFWSVHWLTRNDALDIGYGLANKGESLIDHNIEDSIDDCVDQARQLLSTTVSLARRQ
jgi:hypothetical protein